MSDFANDHFPFGIPSENINEESNRSMPIVDSLSELVVFVMRESDENYKTLGRINRYSNVLNQYEILFSNGVTRMIDPRLICVFEWIDDKFSADWNPSS